jgi:Ca2+-binding RTX toxin-like protein
MAVIKGTDGKDNLNGTHKDDLIEGLDGNDKIQGFEGEDVIDGGAGKDTASYKFSEYDPEFEYDTGLNFGGVSVSLEEGQGSFGDAGGDTLLRIENLIGSNVRRDDYGNEVSGDILKGNDGENKIQGLRGDDLINGFEGDDNLLGGADDDTIYGGSGEDRVRGGSGYDTIFGEDGNDNLDGGTWSDSVFGGEGDDIVNGGADSDHLWGDAPDGPGFIGNDTFAFNSPLDSVDTIWDFSTFNDQIRLDLDIFSALHGTGPLLENEYQENTAGTADDATDRIIYDTDNGQLYYDADGSGGVFTAQQFAQLANGNVPLGFEDFFIVA